jgi:hypothetical protein
MGRRRCDLLDPNTFIHLTTVILGLDPRIHPEA